MSGNEKAPLQPLDAGGRRFETDPTLPTKIDWKPDEWRPGDFPLDETKVDRQPDEWRPSTDDDGSDEKAKE